MSLGPVCEARSDVSSDVTASSTERFLRKGIKSSQHQIPDITLCLIASPLPRSSPCQPQSKAQSKSQEDAAQMQRSPFSMEDDADVSTPSDSGCHLPNEAAEEAARSTCWSEGRDKNKLFSHYSCTPKSDGETLMTTVIETL